MKKIFAILIASLLAAGTCFASEYKYTDTLVYDGRLYTAGLFTDKENMQENLEPFIYNYICPELSGSFNQDVSYMSTMRKASYSDGDNYLDFLNDYEYVVLGASSYDSYNPFVGWSCSIIVIRNVGGKAFESRFYHEREKQYNK